MTRPAQADNLVKIGMLHEEAHSSEELVACLQLAADHLAVAKNEAFTTTVHLDTERRSVPDARAHPGKPDAGDDGLQQVGAPNDRQAGARCVAGRNSDDIGQSAAAAAPVG